MKQRTEWTLREGDVFLVPAGMAHRMLESRRAAHWSLRVDAACFASTESAHLLEPFDRVRAGGAAVISIPANRQEHLTRLFSELEMLESERSRTAAAMQRNLASLLALEVLRATDTGTLAPHSGVVGEALSYIERNCLRPLTLREVARTLDRTPAYITTALKTATGRSALEWISVGRMAESRRLLASSSESVESIAHRVGYADVTHFIRVFRKHHQTTPAAWRTEFAKLDGCNELRHRAARHHLAYCTT